MILTKVVDTVFSIPDKLKIELATIIVQDNKSDFNNRGVPNMNLYKDASEQLQSVTGTLYRKVIYKMKMVGPNGFNKTFSLRSAGMNIDSGDLYRIKRYGEMILDRIYDVKDDFAISRKDKSVYDSLHKEEVYTDITGSNDPNDRLLYMKKANVFGPRLELSNFAVINTGFLLYPMQRAFPSPMAKNVVGIEMSLSRDTAPYCTQLGFDPNPILSEFELSELVDFASKFDPVSYAMDVTNAYSTSTLKWLAKCEFKDRTRQNPSYDAVVNNNSTSLPPKQTSRPDANLRNELSQLL